MFTYLIHENLLLSVLQFFYCNYYYYIAYFSYFLLDYEINYIVDFKDEKVYIQLKM